MSKIALVLSGQLRSFVLGWSYITNNLIRHHEVDVYFHTWSKNWDKKVLEIYRPKAFLVEDEEIFEDTFDCYKIVSPKHPARNTILMYRSIKYADMLRENSKIEYDWVCRTRFDFALNTTIEFDSLEKNKMYFCNTRSNDEKTTVHDQFCIAVPSDMKKYSEVYDNIDKYHQQGCLVNGENLLEHHLRVLGILGTKVEYLDLKPPFSGGRYNWGTHSLLRGDMEKWK